MTATQIGHDVTTTHVDGHALHRAAGAVLWIGSILLTLVWHPVVHLSILDGWTGREAEVPLVACAWPLLALASMKLRRQKHTMAAAVGVFVMSAVVIGFILALNTKPV